MEIGRPSQTKQPSRKGKRAWRKNIDIEDINENLESIRETERDVGVKDMGSIQSDQLFQVDTAGDEMLKTKKERNSKPMMADEILGRRSAVPALKAQHMKSAQGKSKEGLSGKQIKKLLDRAGKSTARVSNKVEHQGIAKVVSYDLWGDDAAASPTDSFIADLKPATSHRSTTTVPSTIGKNAISLAPDRAPVAAVAVPEEGKSYNPTLEAWQALIEREYKREAAREEERLALEEKQNKIQLIIANYDDNGELSDSESDEEDEEEPAEENGTRQEEEETSLSVNKPVENKKKLRKQRNKEKRHTERTRLEAELKDLKKTIRDLENIPKLLKEAERQIKEATDAAASGPGTNKKRKAPKFSKSHKLADTPLELKLSDELSDSLRLLKPEGSLVIDRFRSLQERGLIEPRVPVAKKRKYALKITEKWSVKDITL